MKLAGCEKNDNEMIIVLISKFQNSKDVAIIPLRYNHPSNFLSVCPIDIDIDIFLMVEECELLN